MLPGLKPTYKVTQGNQGYIRVSVTAPKIFGGATNSIELTIDQAKRFVEWEVKGGLIQDKLPDLSISQRELLMTGMTDAVFKEMASNQEGEIGPL